MPVYIERVFSLMQSQWTKEKNKLSVATMKGILNFNIISNIYVL